MSMFRIDGLASGMDTYQMVTDLMKAHRQPVNKLEQQRQVLEWQRQDYRALNSLLLNFRNSTVSDMRLTATLAASHAVSSDAAVATASAAGSAANMTYHLKVEALATNSHRASGGEISASTEDKIDADASIWSQLDKFDNREFGWFNNTTATFTGDGVQADFQLDPDGAEVLRVNAVMVGDQEYTVYEGETEDNNGVWLNKESGRLIFKEAPPAPGDGTDPNIIVYYDVPTTEPGPNSRFSFEITTHDYNGEAITKEFTLNAGAMSLNQLLAQISSDQELGVNAFYDAQSDRVSFSTTRTGRNAGGGDEIQVTGFLADVLKLGDDAGAAVQNGTNAVVTVNGMEITRPTNDFTLNNVNFSLKATGDATITVGRDTDGMFEQIKDFITQYNNLLDIINGKLHEERFRDYPPLVDEDAKEGLTDRQIDQWEEKARSGLLRHDTMLSGVVSRLRNEMFSKVEGLDDDLNHLAHIGIKIGGFAEHGKLVIDETRLRAAIEQDPDGVAQIFNKRGNTTAEQGVAQRLYGSLDAAIKQVTARAGSTASPLTNDQSWIGRQISDINKRIDAAELRLEKLEDRYWRQFAAMEQALNRMNAQSAWLAQQLGGGMM